MVCYFSFQWENQLKCTLLLRQIKFKRTPELVTLAHCRCNYKVCCSFHAALLLRTHSLAVTNDCHLHSQSCKCPFLWLLQAASGLERQHLQGAVQRVPGFLCHVYSHQHHLQVRQRGQREETLAARRFICAHCVIFTLLDFSCMMIRRGILKSLQFTATTTPVSSRCPLY